MTKTPTTDVELLDDFAKAALTGLLANPELKMDKPKAAHAALTYADAVMAEREKFVLGK